MSNAVVPAPEPDDDEEITPGVSRGKVRQMVRDSCAAQGLPLKIEDAVTLDKLAAILRSVDVSGDAA